MLYDNEQKKEEIPTNYRGAHLPLAVMSTGVSYLLIKVLVYHENERLTIIIDMV